MSWYIFYGKGAAINNVSNKGRTPLKEAGLCGHLSIVECLIANCANKDHKDRNRMCAFDLNSPIARSRNEKKRLLLVDQEPPEVDESRRITGTRLNPLGSLTSATDRIAISLSSQTHDRYDKSEYVNGHTIAYYEH